MCLEASTKLSAEGSVVRGYLFLLFLWSRLEEGIYNDLFKSACFRPELSEDCGVKILEALLCLIETMANPLSSLDDDAGRQDAPQAGHQQRHPGFGRGHKRIRLDGRRNPRQESIAMNDWSVEPMKVDHTHAIGLFSKDERLSSPVNTNLVQETPQLSASLANTMEDVMTTQPVACPPIHPASKVPPNSMKRSQSDPKSPTPSFKYQNSKSSEASQTKPKSSPDKRPRKSFDQSDRPQSRDHILLGIKAIGRMLEYQVIHKKSSVSNPKTSVSNPKLSEPSKLRWPYVFVCREDLNPSSLVDHLPVTVACFNEMHSLQSDVDYLGPPVQTQDVYLIPLPRGSDAKLSKALGVRRTAAVAISVSMWV